MFSNSILLSGPTVWRYDPECIKYSATELLSAGIMSPLHSMGYMKAMPFRYELMAGMSVRMHMHTTVQLLVLWSNFSYTVYFGKLACIMQLWYTMRFIAQHMQVPTCSNTGCNIDMHSMLCMRQSGIDGCVSGRRGGTSAGTSTGTSTGTIYTR